MRTILAALALSLVAGSAGAAPHWVRMWGRIGRDRVHGGLGELELRRIKGTAADYLDALSQQREILGLSALHS